jgi:phenylalanyl-tRNA synthetase beta chain
LSTDASYRFERGVDPHGTLQALDRAAALIAELATGRLLKGRIDAHPKPSPIREIPLNVETANRLLGTRISRQEMADLLTAIEFEVEPIDESNLRVTVPSFRVDVSRFEDLNEELARLHGYDRVATTFPAIPSTGVALSERIRIRRRIREWMCTAGFSEAICYSFIGADSADRLGLASDDRRRRAVPILNPLSEDQAVMRTTLLPGLLETIRRNLLLQNRNLRLFEIGNVFFDSADADRQPLEVELLAGLWSGARNRASWLGKPQPCDFYDLKGALETLLKGLNLPPGEYTRAEPQDCPYLRPGHTAVVQVAGEPVGHIGEIHPRVLAAYDVDQPVFAFELNAEHLIRQAPPLQESRPLPRYPSVARDVTLIIPAATEAARILDFAANFDEPLMESIEVFDVYAGDPIPKGKKSISFRLVYRSDKGTLEDEAVNRLHRSITGRVVRQFNAGLPA